MRNRSGLVAMLRSIDTTTSRMPADGCDVVVLHAYQATTHHAHYLCAGGTNS